MPNTNRGHRTSELSEPRARRAPFPEFPTPELATLVAQPPDGEAWLHEVKFDGYRILARVDAGHVRLSSRNGRDWTEQFPGVTAALSRLPARRAILDGEVAALRPSGTTSFQTLQNALSGEGDAAVIYMAFDLLYQDGYDYAPLPLEQRKSALEYLLGRAARLGGTLRYSDHVIGRGPDFFAQACLRGLEGIVSKRRDAPYRGGRGHDWLKTKCVRQQEVVIGGYTEPTGTRVGIGALLAGVYDNGRLLYAGKIGTGFNQRGLRELARRLGSIERRTSPFDTLVPQMGRAHWVEPVLVAQVAFTEWTADGRMRHPSFQGLREDKPPKDVARETPADNGAELSKQRAR